MKSSDLRPGDRIVIAPGAPWAAERTGVVVSNGAAGVHIRFDPAQPPAGMLARVLGWFWRRRPTV